MCEISHARKNKGNKVCLLNVYKIEDGFCFHYQAYSRTNPVGGGKRERFMIFEKKILVHDLQKIDFSKLPLESRTERFTPLAECFHKLTQEFFQQNINAIAPYLK